MKLCVAQTKPIKGNIAANIVEHKKLIDLAVTNKAGIIIFPELSLTGYEPELAKDLVTSTDDTRLEDFQNISDAKQIVIGVGLPTKSNKGICISMILFQPHQVRQTYSKKYLHVDEEPFFVSGESAVDLKVNRTKISLAICYELSIPEHSEHAFRRGAEIYIASVAKSANGVKKALRSLSEIARNYSMTVVMSNCVGSCDNFESSGTSSVWNNKGALLDQLDDTREGILMMDTITQEVTSVYEIN